MSRRACRNCGTWEEPILIVCADCIRAWLIGVLEALGAAFVVWMLRR